MAKYLLLNDKKLSVSFWSSLLLCFLLLVYGPVEQYFNNLSDFSFDLYDILSIMIPVLLLSSIIISLFIILCRKTRILFNTLLIVVIISFIACYIQGTFFSRNLPTINGQIVNWANYKYMRWQSIGIWGISTIAITTLFFLLRDEGFYKFVITFCKISVAILAVSLSITGIFNNGFINKSDLSITDTGLFDMSSNQNVVVFMVDSVDSLGFEKALNNNPSFAGYFEDFTLYENTTSTFPYTAYAVPYLFSGEKFLCDQNYYDYLNNAFVNSPLFNAFVSNNYVLSMYYPDAPLSPQMASIFNNIKPSYHAKLSNPIGFIKTLVKISGLKYFPYDVKRLYSLTPYYIQLNTAKEISFGNLYSSDLIDLHSLFISHNIKTVTDKRFLFIYSDGCHFPFDINSDLSRVTYATIDDEICASINLLHEYVEKLKQSNVYDDTAIVIMADHGLNTDDGILSSALNPIFMVKGLYEKHEFNISKSAVSHAQFIDCIINLSNGQSSTEAIEKAYTDSSLRYFYYSINTNGWHAVDSKGFKEYIQYGFANDLKSLKETGTIYSY